MRQARILHKYPIIEKRPNFVFIQDSFILPRQIYLQTFSEETSITMNKKGLLRRIVI